MTNYVSIRDGGKTNEEGAMRIFSDLAGSTNKGVIVSTDMAVTENGTPNMTVLVATGGLVIPYLTYLFYAFANATINPTITSNSSGNPRIDAVVAWVDLTVVSSASNNNPGALKFSVIAGTPAASPTAPLDATIQAAIGASNPFVRLANVTVASGATSIVNANISNQRPVFKLSNGSVVTLAGVEQLTNKTLPTSNVIKTPMVYAYPTGAQSIPDSTVTLLNFDLEVYDTDVIHDLVTNNSRLTCKTAGLYLVSFSGYFASNATGLRNLYVKKNGTDIDDDIKNGVTGDVTVLRGSVQIELAVNDYMQIAVYQTSGGALNFTTLLGFKMCRIGPASSVA